MEMNKVADEYKAKYNLNYSVLATPAEGLSGRFTRMDRRKYGKIEGVTDNCLLYTSNQSTQTRRNILCRCCHTVL